MAYFADVSYLDETSPGLVERNASEFLRVRDLLDSVEPAVVRARDHTEWDSVASGSYDRRLADVFGLVTHLCDGFDRAGRALLRYADRVAAAKEHVSTGQDAEHRLDQLVSSVAFAVTPTAQAAEPMRRWEDIRATTGVLDWLAELTMDVDAIRESGNLWYDRAHEAFDRALAIEEPARAECLAEFRIAYESLPDFRVDRRFDPAELAWRIPALMREMLQAAGDPNVALPGAGPNLGDFPAAGGAAVSPELARIRSLLTGLPEAWDPWHSYFRGAGTDEQRAQWITNNREIISAAAADTGLPADLIAGVAWIEVGGKGYIFDDLVAFWRTDPNPFKELVPRADGALDETSYGPVSIQVRRAAESLGYDPEHLSDEQRDEVVTALRDPGTNIFVAARHLEYLKAETAAVAGVPPDGWSDQHYRELGARYNGGPNWQSADAQRYGDYLVNHLDQVRAALARE